MEKRERPTAVEMAKYVTSHFRAKENYFPAVLQLAAVQNDQLKRYVAEVKTDHNKIYSDATEVLDALTVVNYRLYRDGRNENLAATEKMIAETMGTEYIDPAAREFLNNDYTYACQFLSVWIGFYIQAAKTVGADVDRLKEMIKSKAAEWFTPPAAAAETADAAIVAGERETQKNLECIKQFYPDTFTLLNDKVTAVTFDNKLTEGRKQPVRTGPMKGKGKDLQAVVEIDFSKLKEVIKDPALQKLTVFDQAVYNAVTTLFLAGNSAVTVLSIYRLLAGCSTHGSITKEKSEMIKQSVEKLSSIRLTVDVSAELKAYPKLDRACIRGNLLYSERADVTINGKSTSAFKILDQPLLYRYAAGKKQIVNVPVKVLDTKIAKSVSNMSLQAYLLKRVEQAKRGKLHNNTIKFTTLYTDLSVTASTAGATQKKAVHRPEKRFFPA